MDDRRSDALPVGFELPIELRDGLFALGLALLIVLVYWPVFETPYVSDDWGHLYLFANEMEPGGLLALLWQGTGIGVFYRPLALAYFWASQQLFGLSSLGYHVAHGGLHLGSSLLVAFVAARLFGSRLLAWSVGALYASAAVVLLQPLLWCVGVADLGGAFFGLAAIALYIVDRRVASVVAFALALGFKESMVAIPVVLLGFELCFREARSTAAGVGDRLRSAARLWPYGALVALYLLASGHGAIAPFERSGSHPYKLLVSGAHIPGHLLRYSGWAFDAVLPVELPWLWLGADSWPRAAIAALVPLSGLGALGALAVRALPSSSASRAYAFIGWWSLTQLLLPLMLPNHVYRYYLIHALPPFLCGLAALVRMVGGWLVRAPSLRAASACGLVAASVLCSALYVRASVAGKSDWSVVEASYLPTRSRTVRMVARDLLRKYPVLPEKATLVFSGVDVRAFRSERGVRVWYPGSDARVYQARDLTRSAHGLGLRDSWYRAKGRRVPREPEVLDPGTTLFFRVRDGRLVESGPAPAADARAGQSSSR